MVSGIDFLQAQKRKWLEEAKILRFFKVGLMVLGIAYCLLVGAALSYLFYLRSEQGKVNQQIGLQKQKIEQLKKTESLQLLLKQRLSFLGKILSKKSPNYTQTLTYLKEITPPGLSYDDLVISEKGEVKMTGQAPQPLALTKFLERLVLDGRFSRVTLSSLSRQKNASYNFDFFLTNEEL